jgi:hypothetical protein
MKMKVICRFLQIAVPLVWCGLIIGLSFIETPLKFQAPEITLERGLGIGRIIFSVLNKVELVLFVLLVVSIFYQRLDVLRWLLLSFILLILAGQTWWLLPILDEKAIKIIAGETVVSSSHHFIYIVFEVLKIYCLLFFGYQTFKEMMTFERALLLKL